MQETINLSTKFHQIKQLKFKNIEIILIQFHQLIIQKYSDYTQMLI